MVISAQGVDYDFFNSRFGECLLARSNQGVCSIDFVTGSRAEALCSLASSFPDKSLVRRGGKLLSLAEAIFNPARAERPAIHLAGTEFQVAVWNVLLRIPVGETVSYRWVAERIGRPRAVRAVANAIAGNRMAYLVPCHRVVRSDGTVGGYRWGVGRKSAMLDWERGETRRAPMHH